jgi:hypothetical protein
MKYQAASAGWPSFQPDRIQQVVSVPVSRAQQNSYVWSV